MKFSILKSADSRSIHDRFVTIDELVKLIKSKKMKIITEHYRNLLKSDKDKAKAFKISKVPAFMVSGVFEKRSNKGLTQPSNMLEIDIDLKNIKALEDRIEESKEIIKILNSAENLILCHVSLSGGVKCLYWFDTLQPITKTFLKTIGGIAKDYVKGIINSNNYTKDVVIDNLFDIPRLCFISHDPDILEFNIENKRPFSVNKVSPTTETVQSKRNDINNYTVPDETDEYEYDELIEVINNCNVNNLVKKKMRQFLNAIDGEKYHMLRNCCFTLGGLIMKETPETIQEAINVITSIFDFRISNPDDINRSKIIKMFEEGTERPFSILEFITFDVKGKIIVDEIKYKNFINKIYKLDKENNMYYHNDNNTLTNLTKDDRVSNAMIETMAKHLTKESFNIYYKDIKNTHIPSLKIKQLLSTSYFEVLKSNPRVSYFIFNNGVVEVSKNGVFLKSYESYIDIGIIEQDHIINHNIDLKDKKPTEFETFLKLTCSSKIKDEAVLDEEKYKALKKAIGYLLHSYSTSKDKAVLFTEKNLTINKESAEGGSGKTIIMHAINKLYNIDKMVNGKGGEKDRFFLDNLKPNQQLIAVDDIRKNFDTSIFFTMIGRKFEINRKSKNKISIGPVKVMISSNYPVMQKDSSSLKRRLYVMELNRFFNAENEPCDYLDKLLFEDWNEEEWNSFYKFMIQLSYEWHLDPKLENYKTYDWVRKDLQDLNVTLYEYIQYNIDTSQDGEYIVSSMDLTLTAKDICNYRIYTNNQLAEDLKRMQSLKLIDFVRKRHGENNITTYFIYATGDNIIKDIIKGNVNGNIDYK